MNLLAWIVTFWLLTVIGRWTFGLSPIAGLVYAAFVVSVLGSYFYSQTIPPIRKKLRQIEERIARGDVNGSWAADTLGYVNMLGYSFMFSTTMLGQRGLRWYSLREDDRHGIGLETRYIHLGLAWPVKKNRSQQSFHSDGYRRG